jgi:hypothetical protein
LPDNAQAQQTPIYIGEASCTAFATRTRQSLCMGSPAVVSHFPRVHFAQDESLMTTHNFQVSWPTQGQATLLLKVVMARVNRAFHVFLLEPTIVRINQMYRDPTYRPPAFTAKIFALFALGEVYSSRAKDSSDGNIPGLSYFKYASSLVQVLPERADLDHVETLLLLVCCLFLSAMVEAYGLMVLVILFTQPQQEAFCIFLDRICTPLKHIPRITPQSPPYSGTPTFNASTSYPYLVDDIHL